jgi:ABC-type branched-subunit amino acid transport system substrate-binding protein
MARYPHTSRAPAALFKIGSIHLKREHPLPARKAYEQLIGDYPESPLVTEAEIGRLHAFYQQQQFQKVIDKSQTLLNTPLERQPRIRLQILQGDAYRSSGTLPKAFSAYLAARQMADPPQKQNILQKIESVLSLSDPEAIKSFPADAMDTELQGTLLYYTALGHADEGDYHRTREGLSDFIKRYPHHPRREDATLLMQSLEEQSRFQHFTIGCLLPLSGPYRFFGDKALQGIELALHHYTRSKTAPDFNLIVKDTESQPEKAVAGLKELVDEKVAAVIGPITTAREAAVEAENQGLPIICLTQKTDIADLGHFVFQNFITPRMQIKALVRHAVEVLHIHHFAILYPDDHYGHLFSTLFQAEVERRGGVLTDSEIYQSDQTDFSQQIRHIIRKPAKVDTRSDRSRSVTAHARANVDFEALFIPDAPSKTGLILPQLVYHDIHHVQLLGTNLWHSPKLIEMAKAYCQDAIFTTGFFIENEDLRNRKFVNDFKHSYNESPNFMSAVSYDTTILLLDLMHRKKPLFRSELKEALLEIKDFEGVTGTTAFYANGETKKTPFLLQIKKENFIQLTDSPPPLSSN